MIFGIETLAVLMMVCAGAGCAAMLAAVPRRRPDVRRGDGGTPEGNKQ